MRMANRFSAGTGGADTHQGEEIQKKAQELLNEMMLDEKIGQLFIVRPESLCPNLPPEQVHNYVEYGVTQMTDQMAQTLQVYPVGGVIMFGKNLENPQQITAFNGALQAASSIPLFIAIDEEGGSVVRIANSKGFDVKKYNSMELIGKSKNPQCAYEVGQTLAGYLLPLGFNLDFAPVADVNTNPQNIVIGKRAFGSEPQLVADMVNAQVEGMHDAGLIGCTKHFPGHGDTVGDTHTGYVSITKGWDELEQCELIPFIKSFENTDMVMAAHITAVNITSDQLPASISRQMITGLLRETLGYDGIVITDAMAMGAIAQHYTDVQSSVLAINAGVDIVLMPWDLAEAFEGVRAAVEAGEIKMERLDESVLRILELKLKYSLIP